MFYILERQALLLYQLCFQGDFKLLFLSETGLSLSLFAGWFFLFCLVVIARSWLEKQFSSDLCRKYALALTLAGHFCG